MHNKYIYGCKSRNVLHSYAMGAAGVVSHENSSTDMGKKKKKQFLGINYIKLLKCRVQVIVRQLQMLKKQLFFFEVVATTSEKTLCAAQQLSEVWKGSILVNVIWHSTQRQPCGADDSVKPCLWRLHARCCWAVIWSSHAKADRQTALSQAGSESLSQSFHRDG